MTDCAQEVLKPWLRTELAAYLFQPVEAEAERHAAQREHAPHAVQHARIEALRGDQSSVEHMRKEFHMRRDVFVDGLNRVKGFSCGLPKGAFYVFPNITGTGWHAKKLADTLLEEAGVACLSGTAFGEHGEGYLRFSVANSLENLRRALERISRWAEQHV